MSSAYSPTPDLRRTGIVRLEEAGANTLHIAAVSGHSVDYYQAYHHTYLPRRTEVALEGIEAWERGEASGPRVIRLADVSRDQSGPAWIRVVESLFGNWFSETEVVSGDYG